MLDKHPASATLPASILIKIYMFCKGAVFKYISFIVRYVFYCSASKAKNLCNVPRENLRVPGSLGGKYASYVREKITRVLNFVVLTSFVSATVLFVLQRVNCAR